ncbi:RNA polymerase sporulation sigma factor SigH [Alkalicoccus urumqiensis]|uniref:RNA polymerase sigma factor SigS n=1 Tax=Alkalicoccus urumqiensis TaxID=1548213 RepID=A0A2P6MEB1_ALKUR|nr:RNA polymerase sporulation sigma factor SigH [Alkalicoccus urumqiensis]PRO64625.1 RNA polymerase sporulation sigma factor SigH [Alkalicoccus urumqiensis]
MAVDLVQTDRYQKYHEADDETLVRYVREGDSGALEHLITKYKKFVRIKARPYFLVGADHEDIVQEGLIGLYKAIRDFQGDKQSSFRAFADLCIGRQIITAIKTATRQKHIPLNSYVSLDKPIYDEDNERTLLDILCGSGTLTPEQMLIHQEDSKAAEVKMSELLSPLEQEVLFQYLDGRTYQQISEDLNRHVKSIDNALQRVKKKMERYVDLKEFPFPDTQ